MISWGVAWPSAKIVGQFIDSKTAIFIRFLFSALILLPICFFFKKSLSYKLFSFKIILLCSLAFLLYNYFFFTATNLGLAGTGGVLVTTTNPIITMVLMSIINKNKLSSNELIGIIFGVIGGCLIIDVWNLGFLQIFNNGNIYFILCAITWSLLTIFIANFSDKSQSINFTFWVYIGVVIIMTPFMNLNKILNIFSLGFEFWIHFLIVSVGALSFGTTIYFVASQKLGPKKSSSFIFTVPISAMLTGIIVLNEKLTISTFLGCCLTIIAVLIINKNLQNQ